MLDRQQRRRHQRHRFRIYMKSVSGLSDSVFARRTFDDLQAACMRSEIPDAVMVARAIQKSAKARQRQDERIHPFQSSAQGSSFTEGQIFCRIFCIKPLESATSCSSLSSCTKNTPDSPLHAAASAGATSMIHFVLCCYVLFHLTDAQLTQHQPQTMASWVQNVRNNGDKSSSNGVSFPFEKNDWIVNLANSYTRYIDELKFSLPTLVGYVLPYLSPHTKLENACKRVVENFTALKEGNAGSNASSDMPIGLSASVATPPDDTCGETTVEERELPVSLRPESLHSHQGLRVSPAPNADQRNITNEAIGWDQDFVHVDDADYSSDNTDDSFSLVEDVKHHTTSTASVDDPEWEIVSNVPSIVAFRSRPFASRIG